MRKALNNVLRHIVLCFQMAAGEQTGPLSQRGKLWDAALILGAKEEF